MSKVRFGDVIKDCKEKVDRNNNPYEYYVAGDHMDTEDLVIRRRGCFATDDVGPAFIRLFKPGQVLYGSRRTYLKKVAVADFEGVTANTTFVLETKDESVLRQRLIPFIMLSDSFTKWSIKKSKGSTNPYVLFSDLANYEFELPDIGRQDELVSLLWSMWDAKESYRSLIDATDQLVKSQFIELFGDPDFGTKDAPVHTLGELITVGPQNGLYKAQSYYRTDGSGIPIVRVDSFYEGIVTDYSSLKRLICSDEERELYRLENDDLVFNRVNGSVDHVGKCARIQGMLEDTVFESNIMRVRTNPEAVNICYLSTYLCSDIIRKQIKRVARVANQASVNQDNIRGLLVPLPSMERQKEYATFVEQSDKSKFELQQSIKQIDVLIDTATRENFS